MLCEEDVRYVLYVVQRDHASRWDMNNFEYITLTHTTRYQIWYIWNFSVVLYMLCFVSCAKDRAVRFVKLYFSQIHVSFFIIIKFISIFRLGFVISSTIHFFLLQYIWLIIVYMTTYLFFFIQKKCLCLKNRLCNRMQLSFNCIYNYPLLLWT